MSGSPNENSSSTEAVFLPMPSMAVSQSRASSAVHVAEELERVVAALLADVAQGRLDPWRLLVAEAARPDRLDQLGEWRELDGAPSPARRRRAGRRRPSRRPGCGPRPRRSRDTRARSASKATSALVSALFWVRIVRISSLVGSSRRCHVGRP